MYCPYRLASVLVLLLGAEVIVYVGLKGISSGSVYCRVGVFDDFVKVVGIYACHLMAHCIVLAVSLVEIYLCQECRTGSLCGTPLLRLLHRQYLISLLQFLGNNAPSLIVGVFGVGEGVVFLVLEVCVHNKRNVLEEAL